jgi:ABC-type sugar transport system substrate-binding protein
MNLQRGLLRAALSAALVAGLADCAVVDQTTFGGKPLAPAPDQLAAALAPEASVPLLVIRLGDGTDYTSALQIAVASAEARDGTVRFRLESVVPAGGDLSAQQQALDNGAAQAREVMDAMGAAGISPERITLAARTEASLSRPELRLYRT